MNGIFQIGATGLQAQQRALHVVANNITNMNTPGFKRGEVRFSEMVAPPALALDSAMETVSRTGMMLGVSTDTSARVNVHGELRETGQPLDIAISGEGFIELMGAEGRTALWRGGTLKVNEDGYLAAANGMPLKAMISIPDEAEAITISRTGEVHVTVAGDAKPSSVGQIDLVRVRNMEAVTTLEGGIYSPASETDLVTVLPGEGGGALVQGSIELSNVNMATEMVMLMMMQRAYAASAQLVQAGDQLMAIANGLRR